MGKLIIVDDNEKDVFTTSKCSCDFCISMDISVRDWGKFVAKSALQRRMLRVVAKIERRRRG